MTREYFEDQIKGAQVPCLLFFLVEEGNKIQVEKVAYDGSDNCFSYIGNLSYLRTTSHLPVFKRETRK